MDLPELGLFKSLENGRSKVAHLEVCHNRTDQEYMKHAHDKAIIQKIHVQSYNSKRYMDLYVDRSTIHNNLNVYQ